MYLWAGPDVLAQLAEHFYPLSTTAHCSLLTSPVCAVSVLGERGAVDLTCCIRSQKLTTALPDGPVLVSPEETE